jgi:excisionase family DNA binding protein
MKPPEPAPSDPAAYNPAPFWTPLQLAAYLNISRPGAYRLLDSGEIRSHRFGGLRRIPVEAVREYVAKTSTVQTGGLK